MAVIEQLDQIETQSLDYSKLHAGSLILVQKAGEVAVTAQITFIDKPYEPPLILAAPVSSSEGRQQPAEPISAEQQLSGEVTLVDLAETAPERHRPVVVQSGPGEYTTIW